MSGAVYQLVQGAVDFQLKVKLIEIGSVWPDTDRSDFASNNFRHRTEFIDAHTYFDERLQVTDTHSQCLCFLTGGKVRSVVQALKYNV